MQIKCGRVIINYYTEIKMNKLATGNNRSTLDKYNVKEKNSDTKEYRLYIPVIFLKQGKLITGIEIRIMVISEKKGTGTRRGHERAAEM